MSFSATYPTISATSVSLQAVQPIGHLLQLGRDGLSPLAHPLQHAGARPTAASPAAPSTTPAAAARAASWQHCTAAGTAAAAAAAFPVLQPCLGGAPAATPASCCPLVQNGFLLCGRNLAGLYGHNWESCTPDYSHKPINSYSFVRILSCPSLLLSQNSA